LTLFEELSLLSRRKLSSHVFHPWKMRILFSSQDDWEPRIRKSFRYTRHELAFADITAESVAGRDLVVPLSIRDILYLDEIRPLVAGNPLPVPSRESVLLCDDKHLFNSTLNESRFGGLIPRMGDGLRYPYILKKKVDAWGENSHIVRDGEQERALRGLLESPEYYRQELVRGDREYATHFLHARGKCAHSITIEYVFDKEIYIKGKDTVLDQRKKSGCLFTELFSDILEFIGFEGLCCFNYKIVDGRPLLIEINPRFGGSLCSFFYPFLEYLWRTYPDMFEAKGKGTPGKG